MIRRSGYTLVELVVATAASSVLVIGLASALYITSGATRYSGTTAHTLEASQTAFALGEELRYAIFVTQRTGRSIEFAVADIDEDGSDDVIRYAWSGTPGDPLQRTFNHGSPETVVDDVYQFELAYRTRSKTETFDQGLQESAEVTLSKLAGGGSKSDYQVKSDQWVGECFAPTLPADAVTWGVSRIDLQLRQYGSTDGQFKVQLRPATGAGRPTSTVLEEVLVAESSLGSKYGWERYSFANVSGLAPSERLCVVVQHVSGAESCEAKYESGGVTLTNHGLLESADQGATWAFTSDKGLHFKAKGTYTTLGGTAPSVTRHYLTGVRMTLQTGSDPQSRIYTGIPLLNTPELLTAFWKLDFDQDPTQVDRNFDGQGDWIVRGGGSFDPASLSGGIWYADDILDSAPTHDFTQLTTIDVRYRNTSVGGNGAVFRIHHDFSGNNFACTKAYLQLQADGTQTLTVYKKTDNSTSVPLVTQSGLSGDFVDLRLVLDPDADLVAVWINGAYQGYFTNLPFYSTSGRDYVTIRNWGSSAEFDYVCVRVSDSP